MCPLRIIGVYNLVTSPGAYVKGYKEGGENRKLVSDVTQWCEKKRLMIRSRKLKNCFWTLASMFPTCSVCFEVGGLLELTFRLQPGAAVGQSQRCVAGHSCRS